MSAQVDRPPISKKQKRVRRRVVPTWVRTISRLQLRKFSVEKTVLDASLLGEPAEFKLEAGMGISVPDGIWETKFNAERVDVGTASTTIRALFKGNGTQFSADGLLEEPKGGLLAKGIGIEGPLFLSLKGEGPKIAWKGTLKGVAGTLGRLQSELGISIQKEIMLAAKGDLQIDPSTVPVPLAHLVGQSIPFDLHVNIDKKKRLIIDDMTLKSEKTSLQISATLDLDKEITNGQFKLRGEDLTPLNVFIPIKGSGGMVEGRFSGPLLTPETSLRFNIGELQTDHVHGKAVHGNAKVTLTRPIGDAPMGIRVNSDGKIGELSFKTGNNLIPEKDIAWILTFEGSPKGKLSFEQLELTGRRASMSLSGWIDSPSRSGRVDALIDVQDLSLFAQIINRPFAGATRMEAKILGDVRDRSFSARINGEYRLPNPSNSSLAAITGPVVTYSGTLNHEGKKKISVSSLRVESLSGTLKGDLAYDLVEGNLIGAFQMDVPKLDGFPAAFGKEIHGSLSAKGKIAGPLKALTLDARMLGREIRFEKMNLGLFSARLRVEDFPAENEGHFDFNLLLGQEKVQGRTQFALSKQSLDLYRMSVKGVGAEITGALSLDLTKPMIEGTLQGVSASLLPISALINQEVKGTAQLHVDALGTKLGQKIVLKVDSTNVSSHGVLAGKVMLRGEIENIFRAPKGLFTLFVQDGKYKRTSVTSLEMTIKGTPKHFLFTSHMKGRANEGFNIEASGRVSAATEGRKFELDRFQGRHGKIPFNLARPLILNTRVDGLNVEPVMLHLGPGRLEGSGKVEQKAIALSIQLIDLPLTELPMSLAPVLMGKANGQLSLNGSLKDPEAEVRLSVTGLGMHHSRTEGLPLGTLEVNAILGEGKLHADMTLQGITKKPLSARFELPIGLSLSPFSMALSEGKSVSGDIDGEVDLGRMVDIYALHDQVINGRMAFNLTIGGKWGDFKILGGGRIENGFYENVKTGTLLKDIEVLFEAGDQRIVIKSMQASDGESGHIKAEGWMEINPAQGFPFVVDLVLNEAKPWRHDDALIITRGPLRLSGSFEALLLEGRIEIAKAEIRIPDRLPPDIVELEVVEISRQKSVSLDKKEPPIATRPVRRRDLKMDVSLSSIGHIFVEGRGLSSEWRGNIDVKGTVNTPVITGQLSVVRGHVNFLGKRFKLNRGAISFTGATPPSPQIDVLGESHEKNITARIELTGPLNRPAVKLGSDPELPQDEVLSRLLFGRSSTNITPYQAIQLASAVNTLSGGGGFDLLGQTRKILGVDQLEIKSPEGDKDETTVSVGKYLSEKVYMEVEKGLGPKGGKGSVVWELTPNITVETEVGENAEIGGGVNWKWDY